MFSEIIRMRQRSRSIASKSPELLEFRFLLSALVDGYDFPFPGRDNYQEYAGSESYGDSLTKVTRNFGTNGHDGDDIAGGLAAEHQPVTSIANGVVVEIRRDNGDGTGWGNALLIEHSESLPEGGIKKRYSLYAHLEKFAPGIVQNLEVSRGQVIGYVGHTGHVESTAGNGAHLHLTIKDVKEWGFGYYPGGIPLGYVDPSVFIATHRPPKNSVTPIENPGNLDVGLELPQNVSLPLAGKVWSFVTSAAGKIALTVENLLGNVVHGALGVFDSFGNARQTNVSFARTDRATWILEATKSGETFHVYASPTLLDSMNLLTWSQTTFPGNDPADIIPTSIPIIDDYPDTKTDAKLVVLDNNGAASISGQIKSPLDNTDDIDWFQFVAKATGKLVVDIDTPNSSLDTHLRLHNSSVLLAQDHDHVETNVIAGQTYWLQVRAGSDASSTIIRPGFDRTGKYVVRISQPTVASGGSGTDQPEGPLPGWGGVRGTIVNLNGDGNGDSSGTISDPGQTRWFQIDGTQGNYLEIGAIGNAGLIPFITAFRSDGSPMDTNSADGDGAARMIIPITAGERIIVAVSSYQRRSTGSFSLELRKRDTGTIVPDADYLTPEGNGFITAAISQLGGEWVKDIPVRRTGWMSLVVDTTDSTLVPFLTHTFNGGDTDSGSDGLARLNLFVHAGDVVHVKVRGENGTMGAFSLLVQQNLVNPNDDHPDVGGIAIPGVKLGTDGILMFPGVIEHPGDKDAFRIEPLVPGPIAIQVISLTEGFRPFLRESWSPADTNGDTQTTTGSNVAGRAFDLIRANVTHVNISVQSNEEDGSIPFGNYVLYAWQPKNINDLHPDTVGIEAFPIPLDGMGNGSAATPFIDYAADKDVYQVVASSTRPITFNVKGSERTFLRVYDRNGLSLATDYDSGPDGASQITLPANKGDLFYLEVTDFDGSILDRYSYTLQVSQPTDDHPDAILFASELRDATTINLDPSGFGQAVGQIESEFLGDRDVFQVISPERGRMTVDVVGTEVTLDSYIRVYDSHGNLVAIDDDSGDGRNSSVTFATFQNETYFIEVSGYNDQSVGTYSVQVRTLPSLQQTVVGTYDDFSDRQRDPFKWIDYQPIVGYVSEAVSGRQDLELFANGETSPDNNIAATRSLATIQGGVAFTAAVILGPEVHNRAEIELRNSTSFDSSVGDSIRITFIRQALNGAVFASVSGQGYEELSNLGPRQYQENAGFNWEIRESSDHSSVEVLLDNEVVATFRGPLKPDLHLWARSVTAGGPGRFARLNLDEVNVNEALWWSPDTKLYDNFDDGQINYEKFTAAGIVEEREGALKLSLFRDGLPVRGYVSTNGSPDGTNLRGFKLNANRTTELKRLSSGDTRARMRLTNGKDFIEIEWKFDSNIFRIRTGGAYGVITPVDLTVPSGEVPDGPLEVRERDGNIEVLHNGIVKLTLPNQSVRSGSFFTFETAGLLDGGQPVTSPPQYFDAFIDDLVFYYDPLPNSVQVIPTLKSESDTGVSNSDHVTGQLDLNFEWTAAPEGTNYQWREGKLEDDGSISYGAWSAPQSETTANVHLAGASIHIFSVRTINSQGIVGGESSLGVHVDIANPTWISSSFISESVPHVNLEFSEPVVGNLSNLVIRDPSNQIINPTSLSGSGTSLLDLVFSNFDQLGTYSISQSGLEDIAGNPVVESQLGTFNITNQAPTEIGISTQSVPENAPNAVVGSLSVIDPDAWNSHTFLILPGGDGSQFVISGNELKVGSVGLDFEAGSVRKVTIRATDQFGESVDQELTINVTDRNDAPVLDNSGDAHLAPIGEDDLHNGGTLISNLIASVLPLTMISDQDSGSMKGIAVYATEVTYGAWEYSLDSGLNWMLMGTVSTTSARLLSASTSTRIRFLPNANFNGQSSLLFCAWDQSSGTNGDTADISTRGGTTAFSSATETATLTVVPVNDAPVLSNSENPTLPSIDEDDVGNNGTPISTIIGNISSDVDAGALQGIAIYNANTTNGRWQFSTNNGTSWADIGNVTAASARLISADSNSRIRFVPDADLYGTSTFHFCAWDQTSGVNGGTADVSARGGASAFSTGTVFATLTINPVEDPPFLDIPNNPVPQFFKGDATIAVFPEIAAGDVDANGVQGGTLVLTMNGVKNKKGWFDALNLPSISTIGNDSEELLEDGTITHRIQLKSDVSNTEVEDFLKSITFSTFKKGLKRSTRSVLLTLTDAGGLSTTRTQTIQVSRRQRR